MIHRLPLPLNILLIIILFLGTTSCATFYKLEGISDFNQLELQEGDSVIITTKDEERIEMIVKASDTTYFYSKKEDVRVRKDDIQSLELSRSYPGKLHFSIIGLLLMSFFFSG